MSKAFSPGSVTLFFEIRDEKKDILKIGSRGVGVCLSMGAITEVRRGDSLQVYVNGETLENSIQRDIAEIYGFKGKITTSLQLPVSQGFGMSAAAALSTSLAIAKIMGKTYLEAARIAHGVEVQRRSGLGDVASQYEGGFTVRIREGIQPYGIVDRLFYTDIPTYLLILKEGIETNSVLQDEKMRRIIKKEGHRAMQRFLKMPNLENAIRIAREFSLRTSLISEEGRNILDECSNATMAMIGNSVVIFGDCKILEDYKAYKVNLGDRAKIMD
jgi:pantoate kinase